jgi:Na+/melibiose symporter-like transporter
MCYGLLGLPLAMAALPIYVQIPAYYNKQLGLPLMSAGLILFFARLFDTVQDPFLGRIIDRIQHRWSLWMLLSGAILALSFAGLWLPPHYANTSYLMIWFAVMLSLTYIAHSMLNITYLSWGSKLIEGSDTNSNKLINAAAWREGCGLAGVILASLLPSWIFSASPEMLTVHLNYYVTAFTSLLLVAILCLLIFSPKPVKTIFNQQSSIFTPLKNKTFCRLLLIYFLNALSIAIPATLMLFLLKISCKPKNTRQAFLRLTLFLAHLVCHVGSC